MFQQSPNNSRSRKALSQQKSLALIGGRISRRVGVARSYVAAFSVLLLLISYHVAESSAHNPGGTLPV